MHRVRGHLLVLPAAKPRNPAVGTTRPASEQRQPRLRHPAVGPSGGVPRYGARIQPAFSRAGREPKGCAGEPVQERCRRQVAAHHFGAETGHQVRSLRPGGQQSRRWRAQPADRLQDAHPADGRVPRKGQCPAHECLAILFCNLLALNRSSIF